MPILEVRGKNDQVHIKKDLKASLGLILATGIQAVDAPLYYRLLLRLKQDTEATVVFA